MIVVKILWMVQDKVHAGADIIVGRIARNPPIRTVDDGMGADLAPICDERGLAVGVVIEPHGRHKFLGHLLDETFPVAVHIQNGPVFVKPAPGLGDQEPNVGPILSPCLQAHGVPGGGEVAVGVGIDVGEQHPQRDIIHFLFVGPTLPIGSRTQGALLISAQGANIAIARNRHLFIKNIGQAHAVDGAAGSLIADGFAVDLHVVRGLLRDGAGGAGLFGGESGQGQDAHDAHQRQKQGHNAVDKFMLQGFPPLK